MSEGEKPQGAGAATNSAPQHRKGHRRQESMYAMTGLYAESGCAEGDAQVAGPSTPPHATHPPRESFKCHSRNTSAGFCERDRERAKEKEKPPQLFPEILDIPHDIRDCGILSWRPLIIQQFSSIKVFVFFLSILVTLQQALSSGYINSVITTIEKRFDIPSSLSGLIASSYEIGNVVTVIFVSYLGSRRHIPVWIAVGAVIMGIGSLVFVIPHFIAEVNSETLAGNKSEENMCKLPLDADMAALGRLPLPPSNLRPDNCIKSSPSTFVPVMVFIVAQLLLGCGGSPLLTLGTTYVDDHVRPESSSMYIGCMYSMAAFGPVLGFLLGAYLLSFHMDTFSDDIVIKPGDHRWVGMWWGGFLLCGLLLILVAMFFFSFPKVLVREKEKIRLVEKAAAAAAAGGSGASTSKPPQRPAQKDSGYGKDIKDLPVSMMRLLTNPVYVVTCLGACMDLMIVSGFVVFLPKYLETQFSLGKSEASVFTGSVAIPGACIGIFMGGCLLKRLELRPKGAVQFVLISNTVCLSCYALLFFLGCDNIKMAGTTIPYTNNSNLEPFKVNLTAACNFNCLCTETDMEPVCGNNGLTYFSPCHAGCADFSNSRSNFTNCACVLENRRELGVRVVSGASASALTAVGGGDRGAGGDGRRLQPPLHHHLPVPGAAVLHDVRGGGHSDAAPHDRAQVGERGGALVRAGHAVRDIPCVRIHPRADPVREPHRLDVHPVEAVLQRGARRPLLALRHRAVPLQVRGSLRRYKDSGARYLHGGLVARAPAAAVGERRAARPRAGPRRLHHQSRQIIRRATFDGQRERVPNRHQLGEHHAAGGRGRRRGASPADRVAGLAGVTRRRRRVAGAHRLATSAQRLQDDTAGAPRAPALAGGRQPAAAACGRSAATPTHGLPRHAAPPALSTQAHLLAPPHTGAARPRDAHAQGSQRRPAGHRRPSPLRPPPSRGGQSFSEILTC